MQLFEDLSPVRSTGKIRKLNIRVSSRMLFILTMLFLVSCTSAVGNKQTLALNISVSDPDRMRFYGKGAGAGMMLTSSMGPMGIAIGVAIDEGIGKDIDEAAVKVGFNIRQIVGDALTSAWVPDDGANEKISLVVERYGFVTWPDGDRVAPQLHVTMTRVDGSELRVEFPEMFPEEEVPTGAFNEIKAKGEISIKLHREAARLLVEKTQKSRVLQ